MKGKFFRIAVLSISIFIVSASCSFFNGKSDQKIKDKQVDSLAIKLNNEAAAIFRNVLWNGNADTAKILMCLSLLDSAIKIDKSFFLPYRQKAQIFLALKKDRDALNVYKSYTIINITDDNAYVYLFQGLIYERIGQNDSAKINYQKAMIVLDQIKPNFSKNYFNIQIAHAFTTYLLKGKDEAINELNKITPKNPKEEKILEVEKTDYLNFDRKFFLNNLQ